MASNKASVLDLPVPLEQYDFIDFGCSQGGSLGFAKRYLGGKRGFGIDIDPAKVHTTRAAGYDAMQGDLTNLALPDNCVDFVIISHMLEHLPNEATCKAVLASAVRVARKFVYMQGPWFDADRYLALMGMKMTWSDWSGHTLHLTSQMIGRMLTELDRGNALVFGRKVVAGSDDPVILPAPAPRNCQQYEESHGWKPLVAFNKPVFRDLVALVPAPGFKVEELRDSLAPVAQTLYGLGTAAAPRRAMYTTSSVREVLGRIAAEATPEQLESNISLKKSLSRQRKRAPAKPARSAKPVAPTEHALGKEGSGSEVAESALKTPELVEAQLRELHLWLLKGKTWRYLRYMHARAALRRIADEIRTVLVIGAGYGVAEVALALEFPHISFHLTDYEGATHNIVHASNYAKRFGVTNVTFGALDILNPRSYDKYDLVYSVEVLEHIEDDKSAARNMHTLASKYVFCLVPYSHEELNADPARRTHVMEKVGHHLVGYNPARLLTLFPNVMYMRGCYWTEAGIGFRKRLEKMSAEEMESAQEELFREAARDDIDRLPVSIAQALGIWCIAASPSRDTAQFSS